jgi:hypothetical protein
MDQDYTRWIVVDNVECFDWSDVLWDASGYVILKDGSRLDIQPNLYTVEREEWNARHRKPVIP